MPARRIDGRLKEVTSFVELRARIGHYESTCSCYLTFMMSVYALCACSFFIPYPTSQLLHCLQRVTWGFASPSG